jgi:hypothetical protein
MDNIIAIRYEGDNSLKDSQKLSILRYINRLLSGQKDEIIACNAFVRVISENGRMVDIGVVGTDDKLGKTISLKISNSEPPF